MATRVNILKQMQMVRGLAELAHPRPQPRVQETLPLPVRFPFRTPGRLRKRLIPIVMRNSPDIPKRVRIVFLKPAVQAAA